MLKHFNAAGILKYLLIQKNITYFSISFGAVHAFISSKILNLS